MGQLIRSIKNLSQIEKLFLFSVLLTCSLGFYLPFYRKWQTIFGLIFSSLTLILIYFGITKYNQESQWFEREIFYYILLILLLSHLPSYYIGSSRVTYTMELKDTTLIKADNFFLGWAFPDGQLSIYLDTNDILGPHTTLGRFMNNIMQVFYLTYYAVPYFSIYFYCLVKCALNTYYRKKNNNNKHHNHDKNWINLFYITSVYNITIFFVFFINTLVPASSPRLFLQKSYKHPLNLTGFAGLINKVCKDNQSANSFPSGHVAETICIAFALFEMKNYKSASLAMICSVMIAFATLILRYHYFVDVLCALTISLTAYGFATYYFRRIKNDEISPIQFVKTVDTV